MDKIVKDEKNITNEIVKSKNKKTVNMVNNALINLRNAVNKRQFLKVNPDEVIKTVERNLSDKIE